jgi:hypothetical protein
LVSPAGPDCERSGFVCRQHVELLQTSTTGQYVSLAARGGSGRGRWSPPRADTRRPAETCRRPHRR